MKNIQMQNYKMLSANLLPFVIIGLLILVVGSANAQEKKKKKRKPKYEFDFTLGATYDDNILKYSDKYIERFENNEDEGRFQIDTYDDMFIETSARFTATYRFYKKLKTKFSGNMSRKTYVKNSIKDWMSYGFGVQQYFSKRASAKLSYSYIPEFYVRHFRDKNWVSIYGYEPIAFKPYAFAKENYGFWFQNTFLKNTRVRLSLTYARYLHNKHFTEYDSDNMIYGIKFYQPVHKKVRIDFGYNYITSDAKGYDESVETKENTKSPDATYIEDQFSLGVLWRLPKFAKKSNSFNVEGRVMNRYYQSELPLEKDELHAGRYDENLRLYFRYNIKLNKSLGLSVFYNRYMRDTDTEAEENKEHVSNEKDYIQNLSGFKITYNLDL